MPLHRYGIHNSALAKIAIGIGWESSLAQATVETFKHELKISDHVAGVLYSRLLESNLVVQEFRKNEASCGQYRFVLAEGITEEML